LARGREIKNALDLLRLAFLYLTEGKSFSGTEVLLKLAGVGSTSKKAVFARFQKCGEWLRWLCETIGGGRQRRARARERQSGLPAALRDRAVRFGDEGKG
jgi:hypothetical protein